MTGVRTSKTVGGTAHNYIYASGKLIRETYGSTTLDFLYDQNGNPFAMNYTVGNTTTTYYYILNLQGDVVRIVNASGVTVGTYSYDAWGKVTVNYGSVSNATTITDANPLRYRGYYYDTESGFYYLQSRYYDPQIGRFINADDTAYLGADGTPLGYNLFAYCKNKPVMGYDPSGAFDWGSLAQGGGWLATGVAALVVGVSVLTCGVAAPAMMAVAAITVAAGAATAVNGVSEIGEAFTGYNAVRDGVFQGNSTAYNVYAYSTAAVAQVGAAICGGWMAKNAPRIEAYNNIQNYEYGNSAARHIGQRSYYDSTLLQKQIIKYGNMTNEGNGVYTFRISGSSFNAVQQSMHQGTWELTVINSMKLIGHFLLEY